MKLKDDPKAYAIMGCAMRVHDTLGNGFLESAYADALELEFKRNSIPYVREDEVYIYYGDTRLQTRYRADFTCFDRGYIIELKAIKALTKIENLPCCDGLFVMPSEPAEGSPKQPFSGANRR